MSSQLRDVLREEKRMIIRELLAMGFSYSCQQECRKGGSALEKKITQNTLCQGSFLGMLGHRDFFSDSGVLLASGS